MSDLLSHDVLVFSQKAKVIEMTDEYRIFDDAGTEIGTIREVGQSTTKKALRLFTGVDQFLTHKLGGGSSAWSRPRAGSRHSPSSW